MAEPIFNSSLTDEEIEKNFEDADCFAGIVEGLKGALAYENGSADAGATTRRTEIKEDK